MVSTNIEHLVIRYATIKDIPYLLDKDKHLNPKFINNKINNNEIIVASINNVIVGYLRFLYFWDNTPFMNLLFVEESYRNQNIGKNLTLFWEQEMKGFDLVMTSTLSNESSQHFYRKLGYIDSGSLLLPNEPLEIIFIKKINNER